MNSYKSTINKIDLHSFDAISLQVSEIEEMLAAITDEGSLDHRPVMMVSATERLANWMQADIQALHTAYRNQHGGYLDKPEQPVPQK